MWRSKLLQIVYFDRIANLTAPLMLHQAKILKVNPMESKIDFLKDLDQTRPESFFGAYKLTEGVMIRSIGQANIKR